MWRDREASFISSAGAWLSWNMTKLPSGRAVMSNCACAKSVSPRRMEMVAPHGAPLGRGISVPPVSIPPRHPTFKLMKSRFNFLNEPGRLRVMAANYRFGSVEIRPIERLVLIDGEPTALRGRAFDLLLALVERRDRVMTRAELYDVVWEGRVVEDNNLAVQVHAVRKLLGERAVVTVPGRGYRFALDAQAQLERAGAPPSRCADARAGVQMPLVPSRLFGRDGDLAALESLLALHPLVTVVGAGGIGKTVVALAAARARRDAERDGTAWVELAPVNDASVLPSVVAHAFGLPSSGGADPLGALVSVLEPIQALLVIDNAEHLIDAVARLAAAVMARAPGVRLLITSQAALKVDGERVFRLGALAVPVPGTPLADAVNYGSVALFVEQAQAADRRFALDDDNVDLVVDLCRHLDGLPLALKLAAARVPLLGLRGLEAKLAERLQVIGGGHRNAPTRQQTLRAALDWSHSLLSSDEQAVFRRLGVFAGSFTLDAAAEVAGDDVLDAGRVIDALASLVDRSLIVADDTDPPRYYLFESPRAYAHLKLREAGEAQALQQRHAHAVANVVNLIHERWWQFPDDEVVPAFAVEVDNVRVTLDWAVAHEPSLAAEVMGAATHLLSLVDLVHEVRRRSAQIDPLVTDDVDTAVAARYWQWRARYHHGVDHVQMHSAAAKAVSLFRRLDDDRGLYFALALVLASGRVPLGESRSLVDEALTLERADWPPKLRALGHGGIGMLHFLEQRYADAATCYDEATTLAAEGGARGLTSVYASLAAMAHYALGAVDERVRLCRQAVFNERQAVLNKRLRRFGLLKLPLGLLGLGLLFQGRVDEARETFAELFRVCSATDWYLFDLFDDAYVALALTEGRQATAARLLGYADHRAAKLGLRVLGAERTRQARATLEEAFDAATLQRLMAEGRKADQEAVCRWILQARDDAFVE
jgi:predicted ATPase/DNA-binding winged helix-turn-helix (wHTH) protein